MMIEMKERMTCLNSILADREAPFTLESDLQDAPDYGIDVS